MGRKGRKKRARTKNTAESNSNARYVRECNHGEQLLLAGRPVEAAKVFGHVLAMLGDVCRYERAAVLGRLGYCLHLAGGSEVAAGQLREARDVAAQLVPSDAVRSLQGVLQSELGDVLRATGQLGEARAAYEGALAVAIELGDLRAQGIDQDHLAALALAEGRQEEALMRYRAALALFQQVGEPALEALTWHQLGRILHAQRQWDEAERHYLEAAQLRERAGDTVAAAHLWNQLALLCHEAGRPEAAETWQRKGLAWIKQTPDAVQLMRSLPHLVGLFQNQPRLLAEARYLIEQVLVTAETGPDQSTAGSWNIYGVLADMVDKELAAETNDAQRALLQSQAAQYRQIQHFAPQFVAALAGLSEDPSSARAVLLSRLGRCFQMAGRPEPAMATLRQALAVMDKLGATEETQGLRGMLQSELGDVLRATGQLGEARAAYEGALAIAIELGDLRAQGIDQDHLAALALAEGRQEEALMRYRAALALFQQVGEPALEALTWHQLGRILHAQRQWDEAERHYLEAAQLRERAGDTVAAAHLWNQLALLCHEAGRPEAAETWQRKAIENASNSLSTETEPSKRLKIKLHEQLITEYGIEPNLLIDRPPEHRIKPWMQHSKLLREDLRPMLNPCAHVYVDDDGATRFALPYAEPQVESQPPCTIMRRLRLEVIVSGDHSLIWQLVRRTDGSLTVTQILRGLSAGERAMTAQLLADLAAIGVIDVSGRPIARFLHLATKKGVLPAGGLVGDQVQRLAADGNYREYPKAPQITLDTLVPHPLHSFHALTRGRRSRRDYLGSLTRDELAALLYTACGVTGATPWGNRETKLRAYPSSGALYAVEIYPLALQVDGLKPAVYHYRALEHVLEVIKPVDQETIIGAMLPMERQMVSGAAALICLTGNFRRHERKYGEGGYRMLIAEAGHISQNLVLAATALGLAARPFGGVFDSLLNQELGLEATEEEFLLSVLVGRTASDDRNSS